MSVLPVFNKPGSSAPSDHFDVLPPEGKGQPGSMTGPGGLQHEAVSRLIAYLMDNIIKVPGMKKGVGLNPVLDLIPVFGDGAAIIAQVLTILEGARRGVPKIVLTRMGLNILLAGAVDIVPVVGVAFAWWFRPSSRNYDLLVRHAPQAGGAVTAPRKAGIGNYIFVFGLLAVVLIVMGMFVALGVLVLKAAWHALFG